MIRVEKYAKFLIIGIIGVSSLTFVILLQLGIFAPQNHNANYCTECERTVLNISIKIDYGNGTIDSWSGISLDNYRTSAFDALNECCNVGYEIYGVNHDTYYVYSVNGLSEDKTHGWEYWVNGIYSWKGANLYPLENNSILLWNYTTGSL